MPQKRNECDESIASNLQDQLDLNPKGDRQPQDGGVHHNKKIGEYLFKSVVMSLVVK